MGRDTVPSWAISSVNTESGFRRLSWGLKFAVFNVMLTVCLLLAKFVMGIGDDWVRFSPVVYLLGNAFFLLYDVALTRFISFYLFKLRKATNFRL